MKIQMKKSYNDDINVFDKKSKYMWCLGLIAALFLFPPLLFDNYFFFIFNIMGINMIIVLGLNLLTGNTGLVSLGHSAFVAIGAYTSALLATRFGIPFWFCMPLAGILAALIGFIIGLPSLRITGFYLAVVTMGFVFIVQEIIFRWEDVTNGTDGLNVPPPSIGSFNFDTPAKFYYITLISAIVMTLLAKNITRSKSGRAFQAIRDSETAAEAVGVNLSKYKFLSFTISAFYAGVGGSLFAHVLLFIGPDNFTLHESIMYIVMIIVGGMGSIIGSIMGAVVMSFLPEAIRLMKDYIAIFLKEEMTFQLIIYSLILIAFIMFEPQGLYGRWLKIKYHWDSFPLGKRVKKKKAIVSGAR